MIGVWKVFSHGGFIVLFGDHKNKFCLIGDFDVEIHSIQCDDNLEGSATQTYTVLDLDLPSWVKKLKLSNLHLCRF